jgi:hypothetical protein
VGIFCPGQTLFPDEYKENIGEGAEIQTELVGLDPRGGCSISKNKKLLFLDSVLHISPATVDLFVDRPGVSTLQIGHHKSGISPPGEVLSFCNHPPGMRPGGSGDISNISEDSCPSSCALVFLFGLVKFLSQWHLQVDYFLPYQRYI